MLTKLPRIEQAVERPVGQRAGNGADADDQQHVAARDGAEPVNVGEVRARPQAAGPAPREVETPTVGRNARRRRRDERHFAAQTRTISGPPVALHRGRRRARHGR